MGSSGGGSGNPALLSAGSKPIPGLPIAGQGAPNDNPRNFGSFQNFLPDIPAAGQGPAPSATGLTSEMFQYKSPQGTVVPSGAASSSDVDGLRQQLAALLQQQQQQQQQQQAGNGQFGAAGSGSGYSQGGPVAPGLLPPQVLGGVS